MTQAEHCHLHSNEPISFQTGNYHIKVRNKKKQTNKKTKQVNHRLMSDQQLSITQQEVNLVCLFLMKTLLA